MESEIVKKSLKHKKCKKSKKSKVISFDEEVVPKQLAEKILIKRQNEKEAQVKENGKENDSDVNIINESSVTSVKKNKKNKKQKFIEEQPDNDKKTEDEDSPETNNQNVLIKKKKKQKREKQSVGNNESNEEIGDNSPKKKRKKIEPETEEQANEEFEAADSSSAPKKKESIRERKRKRHAKLIEEKKLKTELALQQKSLNYLSKWKHSREEWKFEKLRQIWLQQNIYDSAKIPKEFWDTLVEYFNNCKGKARDIILKEALKIIEEQGEEDVEPDSEHFVKIKRARDIIQNLQE